jgi:hypothetical protein
MVRDGIFDAEFAEPAIGDATPLESELLIQADWLVGGEDAVLVIDDTALPKKDDRSVGWVRKMLRLSAKRPIAKRWCH